MSTAGLKLTIYFGERDRTEGAFLADRLLDLFERERIATSLLVRGVEGFGIKHRLRTDRVLTLSEDLPLVAVAVDRQERIEAVVASVRRIPFDGLVTLERVRLVDVSGDGSPPPPPAPDDATKLTLYPGRGWRSGGQPAYRVALEILRRAGVDGASVLIGVDGTIAGVRRRARFWGRNLDVPAMVISVGSATAIERALPELIEALDGPAATIERVRILKRDGTLHSQPPQVPDSDPAGMNLWMKLMLYSSEQSHVGGRPVHVAVVRALRSRAASGSTALRGIWGYDGAHAPHGDSFWSVRRRVPTLTVVVDTPTAARQWFSVLDQMTPERGLITSEIVPAFRATGPGIVDGGLGLAARWNG